MGGGPSDVVLAPAPVALANVSGVLAADTVIGTTATTVLTTPVLPIGTYLVNFSGYVISISGSDTVDVSIAQGTATATFAGPKSSDVNFTAGGGTLSFCCIATLTQAGTLIFVAQAAGAATTNTLKALDPVNAALPVTGYTAVKIA